MYMCPVCGFPKLHELPRHPENGGSYEICPSCGFQFGVTDDDKGQSYEQWRKDWVDADMPWYSPNPAPEGWDPKKQLESLQ